MCVSGQCRVLGNSISLDLGAEENVRAAQKSLESSVEEMGRHRLCLVIKSDAWNMVVLPRVNHILRCTPKIKDRSKQMEEDG
ncbi:Putative LOC101743068 [Caligus rogercresseyi]|uniref:LOC101743068 n=1 Tax=Caligus rogercresseyi TaxID=217165 RepID=A0A7T8GT84_CALRO|nr:Putative LOC101743068 [Caligus rogercresseyi]